MRALTFSVFLALYPLSVMGDDVAIHADAIPNLMDLQEHYFRKAELDSETIRNYAAEASRQAGRTANCAGITSEQLPNEAAKNAEKLESELSQVVAALANFSSDTRTLPTLGFYRNEFLAGFGQGCIEGESRPSNDIARAQKAIESVILLEAEIQRRRMEIIRIISQKSAP